MSRVIKRVVVVMLTVALVCVLATSIKTDSHGRNNGVIMLVKAEELQTNKAFPYDMAGLSAYVNVGQSLDLEKIGSMFCQLERAGDNYVVGQVEIDDYGGPVRVHLYADKSGWIVAFIGRDEPVANLISWKDIDLKNGVIKYTTLEKAIKMACDAVGIDYDSIKSNIKYYDFEYPDANGVAMLVRVTNKGGETNYTHFALPDTATLYEASYYHWYWRKDWGSWGRHSRVYLDGDLVDDLVVAKTGWARKIDNLNVSVGCHTVGIQVDYDRWWNIMAQHGGVGVVLVYKV